MSKLFESKKETPEVTAVADPYKGIRDSVTGWLQGQVGKAGPSYGGELTAPMSPYEEQSLGWLKDYSAAGPSETRKNATNEVNKTLTGGYDPTTSPYYQAVKAEAAANLKDTQKGIADEAAGGGRYWSGARLGVQGKAATDTTNKLNEVIGSLADQERNRMTSVLPMADQLATEEENAPLNKANALQTYGALPRNIQQAYDTALLQEWTKANYDYPLSIGSMASGVQQAPVYAQSGYSPSVGSQLASWLSPVASAGINAYGNVKSSENNAKASTTMNQGISTALMMALMAM